MAKKLIFLIESNREKFRDCTPYSPEGGAEILNVESRSGDLNLEQVLSKGDFLCKTTSGDVSLEGCDSPKMGFTTVSGDISGSLLHGKQFSCCSVSGEMNLPGGTPQGTCSISTVSGDADLEIEEE